MQQLKKFGAIGGAIVLVACWPLAVGQIAQSVLKNGMASLQNQYVTTEVVSHDRRYLSALATTKVTVTEAHLKERLAAMGLPTEFLVQHDIKHGFLQVTAESTFINLDMVPAVLDTQTQLNGNTEFELVIDNINYPFPGSDDAFAYLAKSRIAGEATVLGEVDLNFSFPAAQIRLKTDETLTFSAIIGEIQGKKAMGLWYGEQRIQLDKLDVISATQFASVQDLNYQFSSLIDDSEERLNLNNIVTAASIASTDIGELKDVHLDVTLGNLDINAFDTLLTAFRTTSVLDEVVRTQSVTIDQLFNQGFYLSLNRLKLIKEEGELQSEWLLKVPQGTDHITQNTMQLITALTGELDSFVSKALLEKHPDLQQEIDKMAGMDLVQLTDSGYKIQLSLSKGMLTFASGRELPLMTFFMLLMSR